MNIMKFFIVACLLFSVGCSTPTTNTRSGPKDPKPSFTFFNVSSSVCVNATPKQPVIVEYGVNPDGWSNPNTLKVRLLMVTDNNEVSLHGDAHQYFAESLATTGSLAFYVEDVFGNNSFPTSFSVRGVLQPSMSTNAYESLDSYVSVITNCGVPDIRG